MSEVNQHLPQLGLLEEALKTQDVEQSYNRLVETEQALELLFASYADELSYLAAEEPQSETAERMGPLFAEIFQLTPSLEEELREGQLDLASETGDTLREAVESLYELMAAYRRQAADAPKFSEVPYTHELVRVCRHFLSGSLSKEAVYGRLEQFWAYHDHLTTTLESMVPSEAEKETMEQNAEDLREAVHAQAQGLEELELALAEDETEPEAVESCLEMLTTSAEILVEIHRSLAKADLEPRTLRCVKCGHENVPSDRACRECGTILPGGVALSSEPTSTLALEEDGSSVHSSDPEELVKIQAAVEHFAASGEAEPLRKARTRFASRLNRVKRRLQSMESGQGRVSEEQLRVLNSTKASFLEGLERAETALSLMAEGEEQNDFHRLELGMAGLREAESLFAGIRSGWEQSEFNPS